MLRFPFLWSGFDWWLIKCTSQLYLSYTHVHHHGSCCVVSFDKRGEVTAEHFLYPAQVRLAVAGNQFRALFVYIQPAI